MDLGLFTDSVPRMTFEAALDLAAGIGATAVEIAAGGVSEMTHVDTATLLSDRPARSRFRDAFARRGLRIAALNCSGFPLHPVIGEQQRKSIEDTIRLAELLEVDRSSRCPAVRVMTRSHDG
jgi:sugar phosphate isomerase/epimerase